MNPADVLDVSRQAVVVMLKMGTPVLLLALLVGLAIAASTAFATPVASPVNALVLGPGGYRFGDFLRAGVALQVLVLALGAAMILMLST